MIKLFNQCIGRLHLAKTKSLIPTSLLVGTLIALLSFPAQAKDNTPAVPDDPFVILLKGIYHPVIHAPNLGLSLVDLNDGSYIQTKIYPVSGTPGSEKEDKAIGDFYVQFPTGDLCAYHVPGGAMTMRFTGSDVTFVDDGEGGMFMVGTFELTILEATGIYKSFVGGHNHMVDVLHFLADGTLDEYCFCHISRP
jgi:hypothetical protein